MLKLCQVAALLQGCKSETQRIVSDVYKIIQKEELFDGLSRVYKPRAEDGDKLPSQSKRVQHTVAEQLAAAREAWSKQIDLTLTQDAGNAGATADVLVDGKTILNDVPIVTILALEKLATDIDTFLSKLPVPDQSEEWQHDPATGLLRSKETQVATTRKVPKAFVKYEATKEHPAQVDVFTEDIIVGDWSQMRYTGRITADRKQAMVKKIKQFREALKLAREDANTTTCESRKAADAIFDFVLGND